jgi:hypothetical protein
MEMEMEIGGKGGRKGRRGVRGTRYPWSVPATLMAREKLTLRVSIICT